MVFVWFPALAAFVVLAALASLAGIWLWTLRRRRSSPPVAWWIALALLALSTLTSLSGVVYGVGIVVASSAGSPAQNAARVSLGVSTAMYNSTFGLFVALVIPLGLGFCRWRWRKGRVNGVTNSRSPSP
jgi:hypothetical protein